MLRKVRVKLPKAQYGNQITANARQMSMWGGADVNKFKTPRTQVNDVLQPIPRDEANLEAEKDETVIVPDGPVPSHFKIGGNRHSSGGTPLNLPENSFVYSDTRGMLIKDEALLKYFGMPIKKGKKAYTPAEIAKRFEVNEYKKILQDPNSDDLQRRTAEMMIKKNVLMLGALALAQESLKGFPQGVPVVAMPYLESKGISPEMFLPQDSQMGDSQMQEQDLMPEEGQPIQEQDLQMMEQEVNPQEMMGMPAPEVAPSPEMMMMYGGSYYNPMMMYGGNPYDYMRAGGESRTRARVTLPIFQSTGAVTPQNTDPELDKTFSGQTYPYKLYKQLEKDVTINSELGRAIIKKYKEALNNSKNFGRNIKVDDLKGKSEQEILDAFLNLQKRNYATAAYYMKNDNLGDSGQGFAAASTKISNTSNNPVKGGISNDDLNNVWSSLNISPSDKNSVAAEQLSFIAFNDALADPKKEPGLEEMMKLRGYGSGQFGPKGERGNVAGTQISVADGIATNNTTNEFGVLNLPQETVVEEDTETEEEFPEDAEEQTFQPAYQAPPPSPFLQDVMALGRAGQNYLSITEDMPWNPYAALSPYPIQLGRYSPEREINALASAANTMGQAAAFGEAPSRAANLSKFQAETARQVADTLGRYNNLNVTAENQEEIAQAQQNNEFQKLRASGALDLYDKTALAKQNAINARRKALNDITQAGINMTTNQAKAQVLNELYPNFNIFPETGGMMGFVPGASRFGVDDGRNDYNFDDYFTMGQKKFPNDPELAIRYAEGMARNNKGLGSSARESARNDIFGLFGK